MASYGNVAVLASAATNIVPTNSTTDIGAVLIQNRGPNSIYIGNDNSVTTSTGLELAAGNAMSYRRNQPGGVWARAATADQVSPADTRWVGELR
ncbi:MAG TPA: hypothetical protein VNF91_04645 [Candidatus Acidoferrum sp.]|nr:hypothetical protein [Candidatus Acidoferrum sp.]